MEDMLPPGAIPDAQFQAAASAPTGSLPPGAIPDEDFVSREDKYGTTGQQVKTALEGAGRGVLGSTIATGLETAMGVKPEDIRGRDEENPITSGVSQAAGLGAGLISGLGPEAMLMTKAGELASGLTAAGKLTGAALEAAPLASRIGSEAVKQAVEMAVMSGDDEIAKKIWTNPEETADQAIGHIGLSAALGGAGGAFVAGAVNPLWKATVGPKVESFLSSISSKLGGKAGETGLSTAAEMGEKAGIDMTQYPTIAGKINGGPGADGAFSKLSQTDTSHFGIKHQDHLSAFTNEVGGKMAETLGHDQAYVDGLESKLDKYTRGNEIADTLHNEISQVTKPINDAYDAANNQFKDSMISNESKKVMADNISQKAMESGWYKAADDHQKRLVEKVLDKLPSQETAEDLKKFITNLRENNPFGSPTYQSAKEIANVMKEGQERAVMEGIAAKGGNPEMAAQAIEGYKNLKKQYAGLMDTLDGLNEHLHVGKYYGPQSFLNNLKEMGTSNAEGVLNRLSGKAKADTLNILKDFPETLGKVRQFHVDEMLNASKGAEGGVNPRKFAKNFKNLTPQIKDLVADKTSQLRVDALSDLLSKTDDATHNWSNTARTADKLTHGMPSPISLALGVLGHGVDAILAHLGSLGMKEGGDALRYGLLKFLSHEGPTNPAGFKAMAALMDSTIRGERALNKAVGGVFKAGASLGTAVAPSAAQLAKLDRMVVQNQQDPNHLQNKMLDNETGHYLPQHQVAVMSTATRALGYLQTLKPQPTKLSPLDKPIPPSPEQMARYNRALSIAENPNVILSHIKEGTLQLTDIKDLQSMYPTVYSKMQEKIMSQVVNSHSEEEPIPYKTKMGISLFMQTPLDPSMNPASIMAAQPKPVQPPETPQGGGKGKGAASKLGKSNGSYMTPGQAAESDRGKRD